jgi:hypothetical protein
MRTLHRRCVVATVLVVVGLVAVGPASAYWTSPGGGSGSGSTGGMMPVTLGPGTPEAQLFPGGQSAVTVVVANANTSAVRIASLALQTLEGAGGYTVDAAHAGCGLSALSYVTQSNGGAGWEIPASDSTTITLPNALAMRADAAAACEGATFAVHLVAGS